MRFTEALISGAAGAVALTVLHEAARHSVDHAPQVNVIGERALKKGARALGRPAPGRPVLYTGSLAGELLSNSLYYSLAAAAGKGNAVGAGALLGMLGGIGAVVLPPRMGLGNQPDRSTPSTELMTIAWYTLGGVVAGTVYRELTRR